MLFIIIAVLVALKLAGVGTFSWWLPFGLFIGAIIIIIITHSDSSTKIGKDWHKGMFD